MQKESLKILDSLAARNVNHGEGDEVFYAYINQEKTEKAAITLSPKTLNNTAVTQYKRGNIEQSFTTFSQAFRVMPKNASIALNYLQAIIRARTSGDVLEPKIKDAIKRCRETLESATLSKEQTERYSSVKQILANQNTL